MAQLKRGGKQTLDTLLSKLAYIDHYAPDNPAAVRELTQQIRDQIEEEVKPYLLRAEPTIEKRLADLEAWRAECEAGVIRLRKAE
jgi:hypothetical protein